MRNFLLLFLMLLINVTLFSQPTTITYQGVLTDDDGNLINGSKSIVFSMFNVSENGASVWTETHPNVAVTNGLFQVELGSVTAFGSLNFATSLWLEITVAGTTLSPRVKLNASGYALAGKATSVQIATNAAAGRVLTSDASGNGSWATAGLTNFTESRNTTAPNATVPAHVLAATGTGDNVDIVLQTKGTGAFLADLPDDATTGGYKRGNEAVDLQMGRSNAS